MTIAKRAIGAHLETRLTSLGFRGKLDKAAILDDGKGLIFFLEIDNKPRLGFFALRGSVHLEEIPFATEPGPSAKNGLLLVSLDGRLDIDPASPAAWETVDRAYATLEPTISLCKGFPESWLGLPMEEARKGSGRFRFLFGSPANWMFILALVHERYGSLTTAKEWAREAVSLATERQLPLRAEAARLLGRSE